MLQTPFLPLARLTIRTIKRLKGEQYLDPVVVNYLQRLLDAILQSDPQMIDSIGEALSMHQEEIRAIVMGYKHFDEATGIGLIEKLRCIIDQDAWNQLVTELVLYDVERFRRNPVLHDAAKANALYFWINTIHKERLSQEYIMDFTMRVTFSPPTQRIRY